MYDSILVPVDGSDPSDAAIEHARGIAQDQDATVHVVHAVELPDRWGQTGAYPSLDFESLRRDGPEIVNDAVETLEDAGVEAHGETFEGGPARVLPEYAAEHDIDLIVMGTHGRTGVRRVLLGSTTERTLRLADTPLLAVESAP